MKYFVLLMIVVTALSCTRRDGGVEEEIFRYSLDGDIKGFDPAYADDEYSQVAVAQVYQGLMQYRYRAKPYVVGPLLAEEMPTVSRDGLTYTFKIRSGVTFHDDPAFKGKTRALEASDVVYSFKRLNDPRVKSPNAWLLAGYVKELSAPDPRTFVMTLTKPYRQLLYVLAMNSLSIVAREVVETYGEEFINHPVGTGPYILKEWVRGQRIRFERSPHYWEERLSKEDIDPAATGISAGATLPLVPRIELLILTESQPRWLNFMSGNIDHVVAPSETFDQVFDERLDVRPEMKAKGISAKRQDGADLVFFVFNMDDPVVGPNRYLRQAISSAIDRGEYLRRFYNRRGVEAHGPIPSGMYGFDPERKNPYSYDLKRAQALAQKAREFHRKNHGGKELPAILLDIPNSTHDRMMAEALGRDFQKIGLTLKTRMESWPQFLNRMKKSQAQFFFYGWNADYPDPDNFFQLLYSKNASPGHNGANFRNKEYDRLYEEMRNSEDNDKRGRAIRRMVEIVHEECPWVLFIHRTYSPLLHGWVKNFNRQPFAPGQFKYVAIDRGEKARLLPVLR